LLLPQLLLLLLLLQIINKRGAEAFEQADEELLRLFCAELEGLLRSKTVEVRQTGYLKQTGFLKLALPKVARILCGSMIVILYHSLEHAVVLNMQ
jgi:hypothetical protein